MNPADRTDCVACSRIERFGEDPSDVCHLGADILLKWGYVDFRPCPTHSMIIRGYIMEAGHPDPGADLTDLPEPIEVMH